MTRAVILAAGFGSRLMPLTKDRPKGMVALAGMPLLVRQLGVLRECGVKDIALVGGYLVEKLNPLGLPVFLNANYEATNMVESLMSARELFDGSSDLIMAYGDIVYEPRVLKTLLQTQGDVVVAADRNWEALWSARMEDYASDVETFLIGDDGCVKELGRRPKQLADVEAQYIGLVNFPAATQKRVLDFYDGLDKQAMYDGQPFPKMYMTSFIQQMIDAGWVVCPALIDGGWLEVDTLEDMQRYETLQAKDELFKLCQLATTPSVQSLSELVQAPVMVPDGVCDIRQLTVDVIAARHLSQHHQVCLDLLARKLEISGKLLLQYALPEMKPMDTQIIASAEEAAALLAAFLHAYDISADVRYLNTVLKSIDSTLQQPKPAKADELDICCIARLQ